MALIGKTKETIIKDGGLVAKVFKRKMGEYRYKSPRYGYKRAYHFNQDIYVYFEGDLLNQIARLPAKDLKRAEIKSYLSQVRYVVDHLNDPDYSKVTLYQDIRNLGIRKSAIG